MEHEDNLTEQEEKWKLARQKWRVLILDYIVLASQALMRQVHFHMLDL
jgi:hypothetical protein